MDRGRTEHGLARSSIRLPDRRCVLCGTGLRGFDQIKATPVRLKHYGRIDRGKALQFSFDGKRMAGYSGDTLASALLAAVRQQFVGLRPVDPDTTIKGGLLLFEQKSKPEEQGLGVITAVAFSPVVGSQIAMNLRTAGSECA